MGPDYTISVYFLFNGRICNDLTKCPGGASRKSLQYCTEKNNLVAACQTNNCHLDNWKGY